MSDSISNVAAVATGDPLMDEFQAGRYLGGDRSPISPRTMQRWRLEGAGPSFVSVGRLIRYRRSSLDMWLAGRVRQSTSEQTAA